MPNCISNEPDYSGGDYSTASNGSSLGGYNKGTYETSVKGSTVDFSGNWAYNANAKSSVIQSKAKSEYINCFKEIGSKIGMDWRLVAAVAYQESQFNPTATNSKGALGLFQFLPDVWGHYAPRDKNDLSNRTDTQAMTFAVKKLWTEKKNSFKNVSNTNDLMALIIQGHHDGTITTKGGNKWKNYIQYINGKEVYNPEGINYLKSVIVYYRQFCK